MLSKDLIDRLRERATDPETRTEYPSPGLSGGRSFGAGAYRTVRMSLGDDPPPEPKDLPPPVSPADISAAEARLAVDLPEDLKELYSQVANGGFGPSGGLASLEESATRYLSLRAEPQGEAGQSWPENLLPINLSEPGADCYDLGTGKIVYWDEESLADGSGDEIWKASFKKQAESLGAWLEDWLERPAVNPSIQQAIDDDLRAGQEGLEDALREHLCRTIATMRDWPREERAKFGFGEEGWEEDLCQQFGIDHRDL